MEKRYCGQTHNLKAPTRVREMVSGSVFHRREKVGSLQEFMLFPFELLFLSSFRSKLLLTPTL